MYYSYLPKPLFEYIKHEGGSFCLPSDSAVERHRKQRRTVFWPIQSLDIDVFAHKWKIEHKKIQSSYPQPCIFWKLDCT